MNLAADYLARNLDQLTDPFDVCTVTYALQLAHHRVKDEAFRKMMKMRRAGEVMVHLLQCTSSFFRVCSLLCCLCFISIFHSILPTVKYTILYYRLQLCRTFLFVIIQYSSSF